MGEVIRKTKEGRFIGFYLRWYENGRRRQMASKQPTYAEARRMLLEIEARAARGEAGLPEKRENLTMTELVERFLGEYSRPKLKDLERYRSYARMVLRRALTRLGDVSVRQLTPRVVSKLRDSLAKDYPPNSVRVTLAILSKVFTWAQREGLVDLNPCSGVERPVTEHAVDYLSRDEARALLAAAKDRATDTQGHRLYACIAVALYAGLRKGELLGLRWRDADFETRRLTIARSYNTSPKSGKARHLRLPAALDPILRDWRAVCPPSQAGLMFPLGNLHRSSWANAMLGLPELMESVGLRRVLHPWHQLRHTFASHHVMNGGSILALQKILGHSDIKMTLQYAHLAPDFLDGELDKVRY